MAEAAELVKEGRAALPEINRYFPVVISLLLLVGGGYMVSKFLAAEVKALEAISQHLADLDSDLRHIGVPVGWTKNQRQQMQPAVDRE